MKGSNKKLFAYILILCACMQCFVGVQQEKVYAKIQANEVRVVEIEETELPNEAVVASEGSITALYDNVTDIYMSEGDIYQVHPKMLPKNAKDQIAYVVSESAIASVSEEGLIQAYSKGVTIVSAKLENGAKIDYNIHVGDLAESISFINVEDKIELVKKQTRRLLVKVTPNKLKNVKIKYTSSDEKIVSVNKDGEIIANKKGNAYIQAEALDGSKVTKKILVTVKERKSGTGYTESGLTIVDKSKQKYSYSDMCTDISQLAMKYSDIFSYSVTGKSWDNRKLYKIVFGNPNAKKKVFVQAAIHGREYMTSQLVMKQLEFYCANYYTGRLNGTYYSEIFENVCVEIVPMSNPDGVTISQFGANGIRNKTLRNNIKKMCKKYGRGRSSYYRKWKANARGVDLNNNFNGYWKSTKTSAKHPCSSGYKGSGYETEKESKNLTKIVRQGNYSAVINYHAMGRIIFWNFGQTGAQRTKELSLLNTVRSVTGYSPVRTAFSKKSAAGMADWVAVRMKLPTVTVEIGSVSCPLPSWQFASIWGQNRQLLAKVAKLYES